VKKIFSVLAVVCAAGLSACGDKGADGPVGTWVLDTKAFFEQNREMFMGQVEEGFKKAKEGMDQLNQAMAAVPEAQRAEMMKSAREQMFAAAGEERELMEAYLRSPDEARKLAEQKARKELETQMKASITLKDDKTFTSTFTMMGQASNRAGTWSATGDQVTLKTTTKEGQPATGSDAKTMKLTLKGDTMSGQEEGGPPITIVLKRA
jgi:hypothetical protein